VTRVLLKIEDGSSTANLTCAAALPTSNIHLKPQQILHRKHDRLLHSPRHRQGRLALRTSIPRTTNPFTTSMRRIRNGVKRCISIAQEEPDTKDNADNLRTTARDGCPRNDVRRRLPPFRRQLQGCPAVSSYQGLQQGRGGLHPVCLKHHMRRVSRFRARKRMTYGANTYIKEILEGG
jgi:hypothetical protein